MSKTVFKSMFQLKERNVYSVLFLIAFIFLIVRAIFIPLFVDEVATYTLYVKNGYFSPYNEFQKANNHLLNTLLTYVSYSLFGNSPFSLRLFNVLAFIPFAIYIYKIGLFFKHKIVKWGFYLGFLFSLNLLAYFSLTRGYGLSFACIIASIYYTIQSVNRNKIWDIPFSVLAMILALYANFSLLLFFFISGLILLINVIVKRDYYFKKLNLIVVLLSVSGYLLSIYYALEILFHFKEKGILWWGYLNGFWQDTVYSLMQHMFFTLDEWFILQGLIIICSVFILVMALKKAVFSAGNIFFYFLFLNVLGIILMAKLFEVNYPFQRTGSHLYLFFIGAFCFAADRIKTQKILPFVMIPILLLPVHFVLHFNTDHVVNWEEDNLPDVFFEKVKQIESKTKQEHIPSIYIEGTTIACWDYKFYKDYQEYMPLSYFKRDTVKWVYDYVIDRQENVEKFADLYDSIARQETSTMTLYKRKKPVRRALIAENKITAYKETNNEYYEFIRHTIDSVETQTINVEVNAGLEYHDRPFNALVVITVENAITRESYDYKLAYLYIKDDWVEYEPFRISMFMNGIPIGEKVNVLAYVWNLNEVNYKVHSSWAKVNKVLPIKIVK